MGMLGWCYLARPPTITFDAKMSDTFCISQGFQWCQHRRYIAETCTLSLKSGNDDITTFFDASFLPLPGICNFEGLLLLQIYSWIFTTEVIS
jgi:hypothetical protein